MTEKAFAPVILFVYNRPQHTEKTVEALQNNSLAAASDLFIFSDGPKQGDDSNVIKVREYIKGIDGFKSVKIIEREKNLGLAESVIQGVTKVINDYGKVIVLEDDLVTSKYFLEFMNANLENYAENELVAGVSGWTFNGLNAKEPFFLRSGSCQAWGTWKRVWDKIDFNSETYIKAIERANCIDQFNLFGAYDYFSMLKNEKNSWAIKFYASYFLDRQVFLFSNKSLAVNIGFDGTGVHSGNSIPKWSRSKLFNGKVFSEPLKPVVNKDIQRKLINIFNAGIKKKVRKGLTVLKTVPLKVLKSGYYFYAKVLSFVFPIDLVIRINNQKRKKSFCGKWGTGTVFYDEFSLNNATNLKDRFLVGKNSYLRCNVEMFPSCNGIEIGDNCYLGDGTRIFSSEKIEIGNDVLISHNVNIMDNTTHEMDSTLRASGFIKLMNHGHSLHNKDLGFGKIKIEDSVWIGCNSFIGKGVTIGHGAVVAACSVVTKDVPPFAVVGGNPAKVMKYTK